VEEWFNVSMDEGKKSVSNPPNFLPWRRTVHGKFGVLQNYCVSGGEEKISLSARNRMQIDLELFRTQIS
jgi:hypothetical protein